MFYESIVFPGTREIIIINIVFPDAVQLTSTQKHYQIEFKIDSDDRNETFSGINIRLHTNLNHHRVIQSGPKNWTVFSELITLQQLRVERRVVCQMFPNFV